MSKMSTCAKRQNNQQLCYWLPDSIYTHYRNCDKPCLAYMNKLHAGIQFFPVQFDEAFEHHQGVNNMIFNQMYNQPKVESKLIAVLITYTAKVFWGVKKTDEQPSKWHKTTIMLKCEDKITETSPPQMIDEAPINPFLIFDHMSHQPLHWDLVDDHYTPYRSPPRPWWIVYHNTSLMCHGLGWFWL